MLGAQDKDVPGSEGKIRYEMRRLRAGFGIILLIGGLLQVAVVPGVGAQEKPLKPRLIEPALWPTPAVEMASDPWSMQTGRGPFSDRRSDSSQVLPCLLGVASTGAGPVLECMDS